MDEEAPSDGYIYGADFTVCNMAEVGDEDEFEFHWIDAEGETFVRNIKFKIVGGFNLLVFLGLLIAIGAVVYFLM